MPASRVAHRANGHSQPEQNVAASGPARITSKYQVTIPQQVRDDLRAQVGDLLLFVKDGPATWRILRIPHDPVEALRLAGRGVAGTAAEVHREFEEGWQDDGRE